MLSITIKARPKVDVVFVKVCFETVTRVQFKIFFYLVSNI